MVCDKLHVKVTALRIVGCVDNVSDLSFQPMYCLLTVIYFR